MEGNWDSRAWSPDGKLLAVSHMWTSREGHKLVLVNVSEGTVTEPHVRGTDAAFSSGGLNIAYVDDYQGDYGDQTEISGVGRVYVLDLAGGGTPRLISPRNERATGPHWSPDGTRILYTVFENAADALRARPCAFNLLVSAGDGSATRQVYHGGTWPPVAWSATGNAADILTSDGLVRVATDGLGVLADLGGNETDSPLTAAEKQQMDGARADAEEAVFQVVVGRVCEYEGKLAEARAACRAAADRLAGLPWRYPLLGFKPDDIAVYADKLVEFTDWPAGTVQADVCQKRLTYLSLLLPWYAKEHRGAYPSNLAVRAPWAATKVSVIDHIMHISDPAVMGATLKCSLGEAFVYIAPAPGSQPTVGDVILRCPRHPESRITWEDRRGRLRLKWLKGYAISNFGGDI
jgi:hypothetical protein